MRPVFKEFINMLEFYGYKDVFKDFEIEEGNLWINRGIVKGISRDTKEEVKLFRIKPEMNGRDISVKFTVYKHTKKQKMEMNNFETWQETVNRNIENLKQIEMESLDLIKKEFCNNTEKYVLTSFGKDSSVVQHLSRKVDMDIKFLFGNTSLDIADTYKQAKQENLTTIINPKEGFYQWRERLQYIPTRFSRACCTIFKEGEMVSYLDAKGKKNSNIMFVMGMRNEESSHRSEYGDYWKNDKWENRNWNAILPIRKWKEFDVWLYILKEGIQFNDKYKKGYSRVGCAIACPYYNLSTWMLDYYWYPTAYNRWHNILENDFIDNNKWSRLNCTIEEYHSCWNGGKLRDEPNEEVIKEMMKYKGIEDINIANSFFNNKCNNSDCDKNVVDSDLIAMNMKFLGRNTKNMYCKKHFKLRLGLSNEDYNKYVKEFKQDGCNLF